VSVIIGQQPKKHNYFTLEDYFRFDPKGGSVRTRNDELAFFASEDFIVGLQAGLEQEVGDASAVVLYRCGFQWGLTDLKRFESNMLREFGRDMRQMNVKFVLEEWWWPLQTMGWGAWEVDLDGKRDQGLILVNLFDSAVAKTLGEVGKPVCHLYAGMLAGALTHLAKRDLSGIEIQCYAMGATYCRFVIGAEQKINAAQFWLEEGASANDVIGRL
jgi:predicted hydrocarbon binding protein